MTPDAMDTTLLDTPESLSQWIDSTLVQQTARLIDDGYDMIAFMVMGQGIETMGAFLDKKPFKARSQGADRFALALRELFPQRYSSLNNRGFLYHHLRGHLTHLSVGSRHLRMVRRGEGLRHMWVEDKRTTVVLEDLYEDYRKAWQEVIRRLHDGSVRVKPLVKE